MSIDERALGRRQPQPVNTAQIPRGSELELILESIPELKDRKEEGIVFFDYNPETATMLRYAFRLSEGIHYVKLEKFEIGAIMYNGKKEHKIAKRHALGFVDGNLVIGPSADTEEAKKSRLKAFGWDQYTSEFVEELDGLYGEQVNVYSSAVRDGLRFYVQMLRDSLAAKRPAQASAPKGAYLRPDTVIRTA